MESAVHKADSVSNSGLMTVPELARERRISAETLRYWRMKDEGPASFRIGRRVFYRRSEVDEWFAAEEAATRRGGAA